jgi:aryl-alcohol dehydrogenase-like predicted oxidoreductase
MQYRTLGRTGVQVSSLVLGAMNFGALGRTTQDAIDAPGVDLAAHEKHDTPPALLDPSLRRR